MYTEREPRDLTEPYVDPIEVEIDELLAEHGGDVRAAFRALLHDMEVLARDAEQVSWKYNRGRPSRALKAG